MLSKRTIVKAIKHQSLYKLPPVKFVENARFKSLEEENRDEAIRKLKKIRTEINRTIRTLEAMWRDGD